ncbi:MAG: DsrE/DsrF-like family protein [Methanosaeta sp. PtaU1.Bin112]|nr:MAG: DsrE/DsrF-like family protein [Methanosaeta sp. PtaU1.Bin112]
MRIILLTKTPQSERTRLCLRLLARLVGSAGSIGSADVVVYLAGDGVYNLIGQDGLDCTIQAGSQQGKTLPALLPRERIIACREDLLARGVSADGNATVPANFYELLVIDMMKEGSRIYTF